VLSDQGFNGTEMPLRQVLESSLAVEDGCIDCGEWLDREHEMVVVVGEFQLDRSQMAGVAGDSHRSFGSIAVGFDEGLKTQSFQPLRHGTPIPSQRHCRGLHVEVVLAEAIEHRGIARWIGQNLRSLGLL
jgi:hypothetical protein